MNQEQKDLFPLLERSDTDSRGNSALEAERLKRARLQNEKLEHEVKRLSSLYADREQIWLDIERANRTVQRVQRAMAVKIARQLAEMTDPTEIQALLLAELDRTYDDLARMGEPRT